MSSKQILSAVLLTTLMVLSARALPVTQEKARQRAAAFLTARGNALADAQPAARSMVDGLPADSPASAGSPASADNPAPYYIYNAAAGAGFIVVSGDDRTAPILGYTDRGSFSPDAVPEGLQWLLHTYAEQMAALDALDVPDAPDVPAVPAVPAVPVCGVANATISAAAASSVRRPIAPLLNTLWNQGAPYNILCPYTLASNGTETADRCATGCVATAIAQVMGYYRYPAETQRYIPAYNYEYDTGQGNKNRRITGIPKGSPIDWDNIADRYNGQTTAQQDTAVARLMLYVGVGCKMGYGPSSGAGFSEGVNALVNYFGYDDGTHIESRGNHTIQSWNDLLYNELATGHPIAFAGTNTGGAHAFVLDGYDADGLYHLNWGWGGLDNGYFRIDILAPDDNSGIGASVTPDGYNMGQEAIIGLRLPDDEAAPAQEPRLNINDWELRNGNSLAANYVNWTGINTTWNLSLAYVDPTDGSLVQFGRKVSSYISNNTYISETFTVSPLPGPGVWHVVPVSKRSVSQQWQSHVNPAISYIEAIVADDGTLTSLAIRPVMSVELTAIDYPGNHRTGDRQAVRATFRNLADEFCREVHLLASRTADKGESRCRTALTIAEGGEATATFNFTPDAAGTWHVWLTTDSEGRNVIGEGSLDITNEGLATAHNLRYVSHTVNNRTGTTVYGACMQGRITVMNQAAETYDGRLRLWIFKAGTDGYYYGAQSVYVPIVVEPRKTAQASYFFDNLDLNATYAMSIIYEEGGDIQDGGLRQMGTTRRGILYWQANQNLGGLAPTANVTTPSGAVAIDLRGLQSTVQSVRPNNNPNTLYLFDADADVPQSLEGRNVVMGSRAPLLTLTDAYAYLSPISFIADRAVYERKASAHASTLVLPFDVSTLPDGVHVQAFEAVDDSGLPSFAEVSAIDAATPYLISATPADGLTLEATDADIVATPTWPMIVSTDDWRFVGVTVSTTLTDTACYVLTDAATAFTPVATRAAVGPFRAYFQRLRQPAPEAIPLPSALVQGVATVRRSPAADRFCYDLQGRPVDRPRKGVFIYKGKKVKR